MQTGNLTNKIALVTGASKGIGKAIALELANRGANVIINYNKDSKGASDTYNKIKALGRKAYITKADISKESQRLTLKKEVFKITKKLNILVNNAGYFDENDGPNISSEGTEYYFALHSTAALRISSLLHQIMNDKSVIINISSIHGIHAKPHAIGYSASKAAMHSITESLAQAYAPIRVNTISPGLIMTPMWGSDDKRTLQKVAQSNLLKRFGKPEEVAKVAAFLASDDASFITGANIVVDGGSLIK